MHLIQPVFLYDTIPSLSFTVSVRAQKLAEDFAQRLGVSAPRVVPAIGEGQRLCCQSPAGTFAHLDEGGNIALTPAALSNECLEFILAHQFAHRAHIAAEWECDLAALDLMRCLVMPIIAQTAMTIAETQPLRARAFQFKSGPRIIAIGDALASGIWADSFS